MNTAPRELNMDKLHKYISLCKRNNHFGNLVETGLILLHNEIQTIGLRLGLRGRRKDMPLADYLEMINGFTERNLDLALIDSELIEQLSRLEKRYQSLEHEDMTIQDARGIFSVYLGLREVKVPNVYKFKPENSTMMPGMSMLTFFAGNGSTKSPTPEDQIIKLMLHKLKQKQQALKKKELNKETLRLSFQLNSLKKSLSEGTHSKKEVVEGSLRETLSYQNRLPQLLSLAYIGVIVLFLGIGIMTLLGAIFDTAVSGIMTLVSLVFFLPAILLILFMRMNN